jgi:hypothetical protein
MILKLVNKVHATESFLEKTTQNIVLTKERLHGIGARSEPSPCKSLTWTDQQIHVFNYNNTESNLKVTSTAYEIIQIQAMEHIDYQRKT